VTAGEQDDAWRWDPSLYEGSAAHYVRGRVPYPAALADELVSHLRLDGRGRLLDLGCGPGPLTLQLAPYVEQVAAVDADAPMLAGGKRRAEEAGITNIKWLRARAEELTLEEGGFRVATMAQSFHWMDREVVAGLLRRVLEPGGAVAFVQAATHRGIEGGEPLPHPRPPWARIDALVAHHLGERRRAGRGYRQWDTGAEEELGVPEARVFRAAGFAGPTRLEVPGWVVRRDTDEIVASVFSLSYAAPHLWGEGIGQFEHALRALLRDVSPSGDFSEEMREIAVDVWRTPIS